MADVTLYGTVKAGVEVSRVKNQGVKTKTATQIADFGSKIGFKGQEDLGNGMKAIWQLEQKPPSPALTAAGVTASPSSA